jgi:hypothetical protein
MCGPLLRLTSNSARRRAVLGQKSFQHENRSGQNRRKQRKRRGGRFQWVPRGGFGSEPNGSNSPSQLTATMRSAAFFPHSATWQPVPASMLPRLSVSHPHSRWESVGRPENKPQPGPFRQEIPGHRVGREQRRHAGAEGSILPTGLPQKGQPLRAGLQIQRLLIEPLKFKADPCPPDRALPECL